MPRASPSPAPAAPAGPAGGLHAARGGASRRPRVGWFIPSFHAADIPAIRDVAARHQSLSRQIGIARDAGLKVLTVGNGA